MLVRCYFGIGFVHIFDGGYGDYDVMGLWIECLGNKGRWQWYGLVLVEPHNNA